MGEEPRRPGCRTNSPQACAGPLHTRAATPLASSHAVDTFTRGAHASRGWAEGCADVAHGAPAPRTGDSRQAHTARRRNAGEERGTRAGLCRPARPPKAPESDAKAVAQKSRGSELCGRSEKRTPDEGSRFRVRSGGRSGVKTAQGLVAGRSLAPPRPDSGLTPLGRSEETLLTPTVPLHGSLDIYYGSETATRCTTLKTCTS